MNLPQLSAEQNRVRHSKWRRVNVPHLLVIHGASFASLDPSLFSISFLFPITLWCTDTPELRCFFPPHKFISSHAFFFHVYCLYRDACNEISLTHGFYEAYILHWHPSTCTSGKTCLNLENFQFFQRYKSLGKQNVPIQVFAFAFASEDMEEIRMKLTNHFLLSDNDGSLPFCAINMMNTISLDSPKYMQK